MKALLLFLAAIAAMAVIGNVFPDDLQSDIDDLPNIEAGLDFGDGVLSMNYANGTNDGNADDVNGAQMAQGGEVWNGEW